MKKLILLYLIAIIVIIVDQASKTYVSSNFYIGESVAVIKGFFNFTYVKNPGAAFGFGGEFSNFFRYTLFRVIPVIACFWIMWAIKKEYKKNMLLSVAYCLILGGAVGNLIDRFRLDFVVDFFDFYYKKSHFATFNVADAAISVAAGLLIIESFYNKKEKVDVTPN